MTPLPLSASATDVHATRRGGARHELSARVSLKPAPQRSTDSSVGPRRPALSAPPTLEGWALNVSRGGLRVILEDRVELGAEFEITISTNGKEASPPQPGRVVWIQEEPDGVVAGIEFR